jgi:predicted double-glycine peptidase
VAARAVDKVAKEAKAAANAAKGDAATGGFFVDKTSVKLEPYDPRATGRILEGQKTDWSCVAASCKNLLNDAQIPEAYVRQMVTDGTGGYLSKTPNALKEFGLKGEATFNANTSIDTLQQATKSSPAIVNIKDPMKPLSDAHAVVVDGFENGNVLIRDSLPGGDIGTAYKISIDDFKRFFTGNAVIIKRH